MEKIVDINDRAFLTIKNGTKRIKIRLFDEKRGKIKIGDKIIFYK